METNLNSKSHKIWNGIKNFCKTFKARDFLYIIIILLLCGVISSAVRRCSTNEKMYETNIKALTDTITYYKGENGNLVASKTAFMAEVNDLKELNKGLYDQITKLGVKPKNIVTTVYSEGEIKYLPQDTAWVVKHDTINLERGIDKSFAFNDQWRDLEGTIGYHQDTLGLRISKDIMRFNYTVAMDKNNKIYITSDNPYVTVNEIQGFTVPTYQKEKVKRWGIGPYLGVGYDFSRNKIAPTIGIGVQYNLFRF